MNDKNMKIAVGIIIIFALIIGGCYAFGFGNSDNNTTVNNTSNNNTTQVNNTTISNESNSTQQSSSEDSSYESSDSSYDDGYERPTRTYGGEEYLTAHESDVLDSGWDPNQHEVSRSDLGNGYHKIKYDDGYFRVCDDHGYVVTYGY